MFPLTPDQHHWLDVITEDEGWCSQLLRIIIQNFVVRYPASSEKLQFLSGMFLAAPTWPTLQYIFDYTVCSRLFGLRNGHNCKQLTYRGGLPVIHHLANRYNLHLSMHRPRQHHVCKNMSSHHENLWKQVRLIECYFCNSLGISAVTDKPRPRATAQSALYIGSRGKKSQNVIFPILGGNFN